jgi:hypothetical protein
LPYSAIPAGSLMSSVRMTYPFFLAAVAIESPWLVRSYGAEIERTPS